MHSGRDLNPETRHHDSDNGPIPSEQETRNLTMLHELLLVLQAHESSIFKPWPPSPSTPETVVLDSTLNDIHPSERAALNTLAHLSFLHKSLRTSIARIVHTRSSIVVRAIVSSIQNPLLNDFQDAVQDIERMILTRDNSIVAAYDIVPLARLSSLLGEWDTRINYLHKFVSNITSKSTGAQVLNQLQQDQHTGYPDIAAIVVKLIAVGEETWLRQVSSWVLYGRIPQLGSSDFFICTSPDPKVSPLDENAFTIDPSLWPNHLLHETASSILFVGRALARIQIQSTTHRTSSQKILETHLSLLNSLQFPLSPSALAKTITSIRLSLSSSVLSSLLPLDTVIRLVSRFRQDFLLGHGSLMSTLLSTVDEYLVRRTDHDGGTIKEADVNNLFAKASSITSRFELANDDEEDPERQSYQTHLKLSLVKSKEKSDHITFDEFLLGDRIQLKYDITWPLDLFLSMEDMSVYNRIFNFLLAVKRCQGRLTSLWPTRNYPSVGRGTWTTVTYAIVIEPSFTNLLVNLSSSSFGNPDGSSGYDPESLRSAHMQYLADLSDGLFLSSKTSTLSRLLKQLFQQVDTIVETIRQDLEIDRVHARGVKAIADECVRELEGVGEREGQGRVEKLLLTLDGGHWFSDNVHHSENSTE